MRQRTPSRAALFESETYRALVGRVGANVRRLREARGWTQEECAFRCQDLGPALLRTIERGGTNITAATLARLCDGLGVDAAELFVPAPMPVPRRPGRPKRTATRPTDGAASASVGVAASEVASTSEALASAAAATADAADDDCPRDPATTR